MILSEIITKKNTNESVFDLLTRSGREQRKAFKSGQKTVKLTTDNLIRLFAEYLGVQGKGSLKQADVQDVINFLDDRNVDTSDIDTNAPMTPQRLKNIFQVKSRLAIQGKGSKAPPVQSSSPTTGNTAPPAVKTSSAYSQTLGSAQKLSAKEKRRLIQQLQKGLPPTKVPPVPLGGKKTTP
jgi:hypothetical protein